MRILTDNSSHFHSSLVSLQKYSQGSSDANSSDEKLLDSNSCSASTSTSYSSEAEDVEMTSIQTLPPHHNSPITPSTSYSSESEDTALAALQALKSHNTNLTNHKKTSLKTNKLSPKIVSQAGVQKLRREKGTFKKGRTVNQTAENHAPSISVPSGEFDPELAIDHANLRGQLLHAHYSALHGTAVRSDENAAPYNLQVSVGHARYQDGKGQSTKHTNAAHAHPAAGMYDNWAAEVKNQIALENKVTPKKKAILKVKGFSEDDFKFFADPSKTPSEKSAYFDSVWQQEYAETSLLDGTELMRKLNATNELPRALNLKCDKALENKLRPLLAVLCQQVMLGKITPEEATTRSHQLCVEHFDAMIPAIQKRVELISNYLDALALIKDPSSMTSTQELIDHLNKMKDYQTEMEQSQSGLSKTHLTENKEFVKATLKELKNLQDSKLHSFSKWFIQKYDLLTSEASAKLEDLKKLLKYNLLEKEGTILPPFDLMSGNYNPVTQQLDPLTPHETREQQLRQLSALSVPAFDLSLSF